MRLRGKLVMTLKSKAKKVYGPYKDKSKGGREKTVIYNPKTQTTSSTNTARYKKEKELGRSLPKSEDVDHVDNDKKHNGVKNLQVISHSKNVAKGNQHRKKK